MKVTRRRPGTAVVHRVETVSGTLTRIVFDTRFDRALDARDLPPTIVADAAGYSRQYMLRLRKEQIEPTLGAIRAITAACIVVAGDPTISANDLFAIAPDEDAIAAARNRFAATNGPKRLRDIRVTGRTTQPRKRKA
ncbi:MAG TPA: hypothetical protein VNA69_12855 [Thermoanaerobaculia bacterium]|nr:hypothetical protein [Thermoanaerobaculia bacterium]